MGIQDILHNNISKLDTQILEDSLSILDFESIINLGIINKQSLNRLLKYRNEVETNFKIKDVFCTRDARILFNKILSTISDLTLTAQGQNMAENLFPLLDIESIQKRYDKIESKINIFKTLSKDQILLISELLSKLKIKKITQTELPVILVSSIEEQEEVIRNFGKHVIIEVAKNEDHAKELISRKPMVYSFNQQFEKEGAVIVQPEISEICPNFIVNQYLSLKPALETFKQISEIDSRLLNTNLETVEQAISLLETQKEDKIILEDYLISLEDKVNEKIEDFKKYGGSNEQLREFIIDELSNFDNIFNFSNDESELLQEAAFDFQTIPFQFSSTKIRLLKNNYQKRIANVEYDSLKKLCRELEKIKNNIYKSVFEVIQLDFFFAITKLIDKYNLLIPNINRGIGFGFSQGRNLILELEGIPVQAVSYSVGKNSVELFGATPENITLLTGANSGGKTTILLTAAIVHILTLLGIPVPAEKADVPIVPLYLYRRRTTKKIGSLESSLKSLKNVLIGRKGKLLMIDEFEALTEPGALGRIIASILNNLPKGTLTIFVTHLAQEIIPHIRNDIRLDGIAATEIDEDGNLLVDRQPLFNHLGKSMPHLVLNKLLKTTKKKKLKKVFENMIGVLEGHIKEN